ncbi:hypothetical protein CWI35_06885 [[Bacillus] caldolyticus]|uniref:Uncharacterized protein n=1 Tax=Bacillus caldolyticus TaxID=1394 RepID=A0ABN5FVI2_BACCL|nr:hypothetical protein [[Bacillus] caldolyticus]AUI36297.1 hypothetical protein CWI35_06885 [[Bacillus] caldolyticus]
MTFAFFYRASLGGPDERREQKFATLVGDHFGMSPTNILLTLTPFFCINSLKPGMINSEEGMRNQKVDERSIRNGVFVKDTVVSRKTL